MSTKAQSSRRPPGPRGLPLLGHSLGFSRDPLGFMERLRPYGDMTFLRLGGTDVYFLNHADLIRDVLTAQRHKFEISTMRRRLEVGLGTGLLTSRGELHARQRRLMQPVFRKSRIEAYAGQIAELSERTRGQWRAGETIDITEEMMKLTMLIAARALFDHDIEDDAEAVSSNLAILLDVFTRISSPFLKLSLALPLPSTLRFRKAVRDLDKVFYRMIERRKGAAAGGTDLLSLLMNARDDETNVLMTDRQLRDEVLTLLIAGHETTANLLAWTLYLVAQDADVDRRLHDEVRGVLGGRAGFTAADPDRMPFARMVIQEGLRLYPPGWFVGRQALEDVQLGGYVVPKGAVVMLSQYVMHRDGRFFDQPERFKPDRWAGDFLERLPRGAYFPFSAGDRHCIGEGFAWQEALLILATLVARWKFELVPGQDIGTRPSVTLRPDKPIKMTVRPRNS